jgi:acylphosphatase
MPRVRFVVSGEVQGVNFRATAVREAMHLSITGRVWNTPEGAVEIIAEGSGGAISSLQSWLNEGPPGAEVTAVERIELGGKPRYEGFKITWSAPKDD